MQRPIEFVFDCLSTLSALWSSKSTPSAAKENLARAEQATLTNRIELPMAMVEAIHGEGDLAGHDELDLVEFGIAVSLRGKPKPVAPVIHFRFKTSSMSWQVGRTVPRGLSLKPLGPTSTFTLNCPVCDAVDLATLTSPPVHATLKHWASVYLPCCEACSRIVVSPDDMPAGGCFCCFKRTATKALQRDDNAVVLLVCDVCDSAQWLQLIREAGMVFGERALVTPRIAEPIQGAFFDHPNELSDAYQASKEPALSSAPAEPEAAPAASSSSAPAEPALSLAPMEPEAPPSTVAAPKGKRTKQSRARKEPNAPPPDDTPVEALETTPTAVDTPSSSSSSSSMLTCVDCNGPPAVCCREASCHQALCMPCMLTRYGAIARIYERSPWWTCDVHRK